MITFKDIAIAFSLFIIMGIIVFILERGNMLKYLVISKILYILEKLPYRSQFGLSLAGELKVWYYQKYGQFKSPERCLCGGIVITRGVPPDGWETYCQNCEQLYDED